MATKFHVNKKGVPGECSADAGNCPFGANEPHYNSPEEAREGYEARRKDDTISVVLKKTPGSSPEEFRTVHTSDKDLANKIATAERELEDADNQAKWLENKAIALQDAQEKFNLTEPGSPERKQALVDRQENRGELLAADLAVWRNSPLYNEDVESRMKSNAFVVNEADESIESAMADKVAKNKVAQNYGISVKDVDSVLETTHYDYLRPRMALINPIGSLSNNETYTFNTAHVFRLEPQAVQGILDYAAEYSSSK